MIAQQISVFLENKSGRLTEVTSLLGEAGINLTAFSIAENSEFGILRMIVSDPEKAYKILKDAHFAAKLTDVLCLSCPNTPGALAKALKLLSDEGVFFEYMYAFANGETANVIIRPDNIERCITILQEAKLQLLAASDLYRL
ncbi:MAG: amino acid-binding protein [Bacteroidales bacterium]|nr:amino acid-binding protein [Bacteroidales bacterium]